MQTFSIISSTKVTIDQWYESDRLCLNVPSHWKSTIDINPHAAAASDAVLMWLEQLGCPRTELERARRFDIGGYVGIPFPTLDLERTTRMGKYLALWLLWDDVHVEELASRWCIDAVDVVMGREPANMTRFHAGWWELVREISQSRSPAWMDRLCRLMRRWSDAAANEALLNFRYRETGRPPSFAEQLELRIATIGMYGTACLLEDTHDEEPPWAFHAHPIVQMLQYLSGKIVGLGNDIFSFGKDHVEGQLNLVSTLMHEFSLSVDDALALLVRLHNDAIVSFDQLASEIAPWAAAIYPNSERWIHDLRISSLGFGLWESQAPRYTAHQVISEGRMLRARFSFVDQAPASRARVGLCQPREVVVQ